VIRCMPRMCSFWVLGLRHGEVLGLRWEDVDFTSSELTIGWQIQRIDCQLLHRQTTTEASDAPLPLVPVCEVALHDRAAAHDRDKKAAGPDWRGSGLVFTTRTGRPLEPRNFNRSFAAACSRSCPADPGPRPQDVRLAAGHARRSPACGHAGAQA
jgi:integrase